MLGDENDVYMHVVVDDKHMVIHHLGDFSLLGIFPPEEFHRISRLHSSGGRENLHTARPMEEVMMFLTSETRMLLCVRIQRNYERNDYKQNADEEFHYLLQTQPFLADKRLFTDSKTVHLKDSLAYYSLFVKLHPCIPQKPL